MAIRPVNQRTVLRLHQQFYPLFRDLFVDSNPVPVKAAMAHAGFCDERVRLPLVPMAEAGRKVLNASLSHCGMVPGRPA